MDSTLQAPAKRLPWYRNLGMQVLVSLVLGIAVGFMFPAFSSKLKLLGDMFLSLIKAGVAPLVFLTIVHGIASAGDVKSAHAAASACGHRSARARDRTASPPRRRPARRGRG